MVKIATIAGLTSICLLLCCINTAAQCKQTKLDDRLIESVSPKFRKQFEERFNRFLCYKTNHDFSSLYELMAKGYLQQRTREEFVRDSAEYYSGVKFLSFLPTSITETNTAGQPPDLWLIEGSIAEEVHGKKRETITVLEVRAENGQMLFVDIDSRPRHSSQAPQVDTRQDPPPEWVSDGCSLWPDGDYRDCCVTHDRDYFRGGTSDERKASDKRLRQCVRAKGHKYISRFMYLGVRIGGVPWLPTKFRWGFGQSKTKQKK